MGGARLIQFFLFSKIKNIFFNKLKRKEEFWELDCIESGEEALSGSKMPEKSTKGQFSMKPFSKLTSGEIAELMKPLIFGNHQKHFKLLSWGIGFGEEQCEISV